LIWYDTDTMDEPGLQTRVQQLEVELESVKTALAGKPDLDIDEKNWETIEPAVRKARKEVFEKRYGEG